MTKCMNCPCHIEEAQIIKKRIKKKKNNWKKSFSNSLTVVRKVSGRREEQHRIVSYYRQFVVDIKMENRKI